MGRLGSGTPAPDPRWPLQASVPTPSRPASPLRTSAGGSTHASQLHTTRTPRPSQTEVAPPNILRKASSPFRQISVLRTTGSAHQRSVESIPDTQDRQADTSWLRAEVRKD